MRAVVQRVTRASVTVDDEVVGAIEAGLCVLVGVTHDDETPSADRLAEKLWRLRVLSDDQGLMNLSVGRYGAARCWSSASSRCTATPGRGAARATSPRPAPNRRQPLVERVVERLRQLGATVATGRFGADMAVELVNDGPVTVLVET